MMIETRKLIRIVLMDVIIMLQLILWRLNSGRLVNPWWRHVYLNEVLRLLFYAGRCLGRFFASGEDLLKELFGFGSDLE